MERFADLYMACIPDGPVGRVACPARQAQIDATETAGARRQRYYAWKLLELALERTLGLDGAQVEFFRDENGKWGCEQCFFTISHSESAVAVAVSDRPIGADIECLDHLRKPGLAPKILTEKELTRYGLLPEEEKDAWLLRIWCAKESLFKRSGGDRFLPGKTEVPEGIPTGIVQLGGNRYAYAVATENSENLRIITDIQL